MKPKTYKILIIGLALMIFGPIIGWVLMLAGYFHFMATMAQDQPRVQPGVIPDFQQIASQMRHSALQLIYFLIPVLLGALSGAVGTFLTLYALVTHFFRPKPDA